MNKFRIFIDFSGSPAALEELLGETQAHELLFARAPGDSVLAEAGADPQLALAEIAFGQPDPHIETARNLKWIHVSSSGITRYDNPEFREWVSRRKIIVTNSASVYQEPCALHALSFLLAQARCLPAGLASRTANGSPEWNALRNSCATFQEKTVLILGYGAIGHRLAELLQPFGVTIIGYRRKPRGDETIRIISENQIAEFLARADHVVNILPDSAATRHFFDHTRFVQMKPGAAFYNIGRGATVAQDALLQVLRSKHLAAAWLDVNEPEPLPENHPLWNEPNCHITPHIAGGHFEESKTLVRHFLDNLARFTKGEPLVDRVM